MLIIQDIYIPICQGSRKVWKSRGASINVMGIIWGWLGTPRDDRPVRAMIKPIIDEDSCYKDIVLVKKAAGVAIVHVIQSSVKSYKNRCINSCCLEFPLPWVGLSSTLFFSPWVLEFSSYFFFSPSTRHLWHLQGQSVKSASNRIHQQVL